MLLAILMLNLFHWGPQGPSSEIRIEHKTYKYYLKGDCFDFLEWDEVRLENKKSEDRINSFIRSRLNDYKLDESDAAGRCDDRTMEYQQSCQVVYAKNDLISYELSSSTYLQTTGHTAWKSENFNFDVQTGKLIDFHELIDSAYFQSVDSLIIIKLEEQAEINSSMEERHYNLNHLDFVMQEVGISLRVPVSEKESHGTTYSVWLSYVLLKPYINIQGPLSRFYN